jgi:hypothetical protein
MRIVWRSVSLLVPLAAIVAGCGREPTAPPPITAPPPTDGRAVPGFFFAWSWLGNAYASPIPTQPYDVSQCPEHPTAPCLNAAVYRQQWNDVLDWHSVAAWAGDPKHRGHLFIIGDAVHDSAGFGGLYADNPVLFAADYCAFVRGVRAVDSTAEFTPGLMEDFASEAWLNDLAAAIVALHDGGHCSFHPVSEWEFNLYPRWSQGIAEFKAYVDRKAAWAASRPAPVGVPLVLGAWTLGWGGDDIPNDDPAYLVRLREVKAWLFAHENVRMVRYLALEPWPADKPDPHPLADKNGNLNATGRVYAEVTGRIAGPRLVRPRTTCRWIAERTGGSAPYMYKWLVNGAPAATQPWIDRVGSDSGFVLTMIVTDAAGASSTATLDVTVSEKAPVCGAE